MQGEAGEIAAIVEREKVEAEELRKRHQERIDHLVERRRELLRRSGCNLEEMTRKALLERPEDPRTVRLRQELDELRRVHDQRQHDDALKLRELTEKLRVTTAESARSAANARDLTQVLTENQQLRQQVQLREKELLEERQRMEELRRQQAEKQQMLDKRLKALEDTPLIGPAGSTSVDQVREAHRVKLPSWMRIGK